MVYKYSWRRDSYPVSAQEAGEYLNDLSKDGDGVTAAEVLEVSRDEDALLHPCFEWDDSKAAEAHRLYQARKLIGNLVCAVIKEDPLVKVPEKTRAFVSVSAPATEGHFKPIMVAMANVDDRRIVLENAKRDALAFENKYSGLTEFSEVFDAIDRVVQ